MSAAMTSAFSLLVIMESGSCRRWKLSVANHPTTRSTPRTDQNRIAEATLEMATECGRRLTSHVTNPAAIHSPQKCNNAWRDSTQEKQIHQCKCPDDRRRQSHSVSPISTDVGIGQVEDFGRG